MRALAFLSVTLAALALLQVTTQADNSTQTPPTTTTEATSVMTKIMGHVVEKIQGVNDIVSKAMTATIAFGHNLASEQLTKIQKEMGHVGQQLRGLDYQNFSHVAEGLGIVGGKLFGISGNATKVRQELLQAAVKGLTGGTFCKSPVQVTTSMARTMMRNIVGNISNLSNGSLDGGGTVMGQVAEAAERAGYLSTGMGILIGAFNCLENMAPLLAFIG